VPRSGSAPKVAKRPLRIGVIGLGVGRFHVNYFSQVASVQVVAVADHSGRRVGGDVNAYAKHYGATAYQEGIDLLDCEELDAVSICSAPSSHRVLVERAAKRGVAVLLEKPMAPTLADCDAMIRACDPAHVAFQMDFPMREVAPVRSLKGLLDSGDIGEPILATADYVMGPRPTDHWVWRPEEGVGPLGENTCHTIDVLRLLLGEVTRVYAEPSPSTGDTGGGLPEAAAFTMRFATGAVAAVVGGAVATNEQGISPWLDLFCSEGQATLTGSAHTYTRLRWSRRGRGHTAREIALSLEPKPPSTLGVYDTYPLLDAALRRFIANLQGEDEPLASGYDGREAVRIATAIVGSCRSGLPADTPAGSGRSARVP